MTEEKVFEVEDNECEFNEICSDLKCHPFPSPWKMFFKVEDEADEHYNEVSEFVIDNAMEMDQNNLRDEQHNVKDLVMDHDVKSNSVFDEKKVNSLKESILNAEDNTSVIELKDVDVLFTVPSNELPSLFHLLDVKSMSEASLTLLLNIFLLYKDDISMATATRFVCCVVRPIIFDVKKNSLRSLLTTILQFSEVYPKAIIDEMIIPYLRDKALDDQQLELLSQISKIHLPDDYVAYGIKHILENAQPNENTFTILQIIIERKVSLEQGLNDQLLKKLLSWSSTHCKNVKFTKLLTSILSAYGSEFSQLQFEVCDEIITANKTIIKKAAENLLKKLKQDLL